jgi:hypothetical protein
MAALATAEAAKAKRLLAAAVRGLPTSQGDKVV